MRLTLHVRRTSVAVVALVTLSLAAHRVNAQSLYGRAEMGVAHTNIFRSDAPPVGSGLPDPSLADDYGSRFNGQNLDGVGLFRIDAPTGPGYYACTTERIGPRTLLTAAHCVTDPFTGALFSTVNTARVGYMDPNNVFSNRPVLNVQVQSTWLGFDNPANRAYRDVAVLNFADVLPDYITTYDIYDSGPLGSQTPEGQQAVIAGFGAFGGGTGQPAFDLYRRVASNVVSFAADYAPYFGFGDLFLDFDDAEGHWNTTCLIEGACKAPTTGVTEGIGGQGDSGGPLFIGGRLAGLSSYGTYYCTPGTEDTTCDPFVADTTSYPGFRPRVYDSYGSLSAYAPVSANLEFIRAATIPEPSTFSLVGIGVAVAAVGARYRRVRRPVA